MYVFDALNGKMSSFRFAATDDGKMIFRPRNSTAKTPSFTPAPLFIALGLLEEDNEIREFAEQHGPLFGTSFWSEGEGAIVESIADWKAAADVMRCALKLKAFADGKAGLNDVRDFYHALVVPGRQGFVVIAGCVFPGGESSAYWDGLRIGECEHSYYNEDGSRVSVDIRACESLSVNIVFTSHDYVALPQSVLDEERIYGDATTAPDFPRSDMSECIKQSLTLLIQAHTDSVRMGFTGWTYQPLVDSMLTGIWHEFGQAFSRETIGICKECGKIIDCTNERNGLKEYCSKQCRDKARNRRNWAKTKLRRAIEQGLTIAEAAERCSLTEDAAIEILEGRKNRNRIAE